MNDQGVILNNISICILCGGRSTRFGTNKSFYTFGKKTLIEQILDKFKDQSDDIFLQASKYPNLKLNSNSKMVHQKVIVRVDFITGKGPLGGIYSGLIHARHEKVFVIASDLPFINKSILQEILRHSKFSLVVPRWSNGFVEPLCALYSKELIPIIHDQLIKDDLKISNLFDLFKKSKTEYNGLNIKYLSIEYCITSGIIDRNCFKNINYLADLDK